MMKPQRVNDYVDYVDLFSEAGALAVVKYAFLDAAVAHSEIHNEVHIEKLVICELNVPQRS